MQVDKGILARSAVRLLVVVWRACPGATLGSVEGTMVPLPPCLYPGTQPAGKTSASSSLGRVPPLGSSLHGELLVIMEPFVEEPVAFLGWARLCTWGAACALSRNPGTWDEGGQARGSHLFDEGNGTGTEFPGFRGQCW